jgi:hypothetical protein
MKEIKFHNRIINDGNNINHSVKEVYSLSYE